MGTGLMAILVATGGVVLAEMGDKTQLLAMAFATRFKAAKVMIGVFIATVFNHALAVAVGSYITRFEAVEIWISGIASLSFIFFGLWTIRGDKLEGEQNRSNKFGAVATVAIAFFLAEMGDKTQLATLAISAKFPDNPVNVLIGTTLGMLIADGIGIVVGVVMCRKIPERTVKLVSAGAFILFGFIGSYQVGANQLGLSMPVIILILAGLAGLTAGAVYWLLRKNRETETENPDVAAYCNIRTVDDEK